MKLKSHDIKCQPFATPTVFRKGKKSETRETLGRKLKTYTSPSVIQESATAARWEIWRLHIWNLVRREIARLRYRDGKGHNENPAML